jgi:hypothetical protein
MVTTRSAHPSALWPGIYKWFGNTYDELPKPYESYFQMETSDKAYEEIAEAYGFGLAAEKAEGASIQYDTDGEGYKSRFTNKTYGLGYIVTREAIEDNQYKQLSERRSRELARSMNTTKCIVHANILNRGFATYLGGDGVVLFSAAHPTQDGNQSNLLTAADLSETALESAATEIMLLENARGLKVAAKPRTLVIHPSEWANATRILESDLQSESADNNVNALKVKGVVDQVVMDPYLTDTDAWFLTTDIPDGLISFSRRALEFNQDNDFDTENAKAKATERYVPGWADWRGVFGSAGS